MAQEDRKSDGLAPATRLARRFRESRELSHPFPALETLSGLAVVEHHAALPCGLDGILLPREEGKHRVLLSENKAPTRRRFTIGHEIGHIVIPWHAGTISCSVGVEGASFGDEMMWTIEREANDFASELVVPGDWLASRLEVDGPLAGLVQEAATLSLASVHATAWAASRVCPRPARFLVFDGPRLTIDQPTGDCWLNIDASSLYQRKSRDELRSRDYIVSVEKRGERTLVVVEGLEVVSVSAPTVDSASLLSALLEARPEADHKRLRHSIAGIVGAAWDRFRKADGCGVERFIGFLLNRFDGRPELADLRAHSDFPSFLRARAEELHAKHGLPF